MCVYESAAVRDASRVVTEGKEVEKYKLERTEALSKSITDALAEAGGRWSLSQLSGG